MRFYSPLVRKRRRYLLIPIVVMMAVPMLIVWANTMSRPGQANVVKTDSSPSPLCHKGDPLAGISNPLRFRVLSSCDIASGVVKSVKSTDDGVWIGVEVDARFSTLIGPGNIGNQNGLLILEIGTQENGVALWIGERISFVGPLVYDVENQFNAFCPVWSIVAS